MTSPFALFRKNQKVMMVALIGMAMFSFVVLGAIDMSSQGGMEAVPAVMGMFLGGVVCWILSAWVANQNTSGIITWTVVGCIVGVSIGSFAGGSIGGPSDIVKTKAGGLSRAEVERLVQQRSIANEFVRRSFFTVNSELEPLMQIPQFANQVFRSLQQHMFGFGEEPRKDVVLGYILRNEADKMGLEVNDTAVLDFITRFTQNKLGRSKFSEIRKELGLSESQLFDILRSELRAREAYRLLVPSAEPTPEMRWQYYRRLNLIQSCDVVPISVEYFEDQVTVPGEDKLKAFFEEHKTVSPGEEEAGAPGFKQPDRVRLAYVQMSYDKVAESIPEISDDEVEAYYEENKENYRSFADPFPTDNTPTNDDPTPDGPSLDDPKSDDPMTDDPQPDEKPKDDKKEENPTTDGKPKSDSKEVKEKTDKKESADPKPETEKPSKPTAEEKPADNKPTEEKPENNAPENTEEPEKAGEKSSSVLKIEAVRGFASLQDDPKEDQPKTEQPAEATEKKDEPKKTETQPAGDSQPEEAKKEEKTDSKSEPPVKEETEKNEESKDDAATPKDGDKEAKSESEKPAPMETEEKEKPVYRPLDDDLKEEIREQIKQDRAFAKLSELASTTRGKMRELGLAHNLDKKNDDYLDASQVAEALKEYATEKGFKYGSTPYVSAEELRDGRYAIGATFEPGSNQLANRFEQRSFESTVDIIFATTPEQLYTLFDAESVNANDDLNVSSYDRFVYWKIGHKEEHVPEFDDKGIKSQVASQWKKQEARTLAKERAQEIAKLIEKAGDKEITEVIADMTEDNTEDSPSLVVTGTGPFSWLTGPTVPPRSGQPQQPITLTQIPFLSDQYGIGEEFMQVVFNEIDKGGVGVAPNVDRSTYFVVKVNSREEDKVIRERAMNATTRDQEMNGPPMGIFSGATQQMLGRDMSKVHVDFVDALKKQYAVEWVEDEKEKNANPR